MKKALLILTPALLVVAGAAHAVDPEQIEKRLQRVEQQLGSGALLELLQRNEALQQEVQQLRGLVEEQRFEIEGLKKRQRELYLDSDRRISALERESDGSGPALASPPTPNPPSAPTAASQPADDETAAPPSAALAVRSDKEERAAYQEAFDLLRQLKYEQAITAFSAFLTAYPDGRYAHIAQYWLGEANYARRDYKAAIAAYETLRKNYPRSPKVIEALLKIGYSHYELGDRDKARQVMEGLIAQYPNTSEANQAQNLLNTLRVE